MTGTTGHACERSGIYQSTCCKEQIALSKGNIFPPCSHCHRGATWTLIRPTQN